MVILIAAAIVSFIPSILMFIFLRNNRKEDEEYRKDCLKLLGKGLLIALLVFLADLVLNIAWKATGLGGKNSIVDELFRCFIINALVEELSKFFTARKYIYKDKSKTSRLDIISYLVIAAIAFGLVEDVVYVLSTNIGQIIVRGLLMGHVPYAMLTGQLYGKGIAEKKPVWKILALVFAILLHGSYNFLLGDDLPDWAAFVVVTEVALETIYMIYMIFFIRKKRQDPEYTSPVFTEE